MVQDVNATFALVRTVVFGNCPSRCLEKNQLREMHRCCQPFRVHRPCPLCFDYELHILILLWRLLPVRCVGHCDRCPYFAHITSHVCRKSLIFFHILSLNVVRFIRLYLSLNRKGAFTSMIGLEVGWTSSYTLTSIFFYSIQQPPQLSFGFSGSLSEETLQEFSGLVTAVTG